MRWSASTQPKQNRTEVLIRKPILRLAILVFVCVTTLLYSQEKKNASNADSSLGKEVFASACAGCHGLDGKGGEHAPNIVTNPEVQRLPEKELTEIISGGVPGTGMPSFGSLGPESVQAIADYVEELQGKVGHTPLPGDPRRGETIFFGKAECSNCHMAGGRGGFIGPDLTPYAQTHSAEQIRAAILNPAERDTSESAVAVLTTAGERYDGIIRNEDNFSLELQSTDGAFHLLSKANVKSIEQRPIMPSNYGSTLSQTELNDVVSYIMSLESAAPKLDWHGEDDE